MGHSPLRTAQWYQNTPRFATPNQHQPNKEKQLEIGHCLLHIKGLARQELHEATRLEG